jgi:DNA replication protein DnaC
MAGTGCPRSSKGLSSATACANFKTPPDPASPTFGDISDFQGHARGDAGPGYALAAGDWVETGANLIAIGNSGAGKTHLRCAVGHALVEAGRRVLYTGTIEFQAAPRGLELEAALAKPAKFDLIILDDITYRHRHYSSQEAWTQSAIHRSPDTLIFIFNAVPSWRFLQVR